MRKVLTIIAAVLALAMLTASVAIAGNGRGVEKLDIVAEYEPGEPIVGTAKLIRRADGLKATAKVSGLEVGGVYTFWWVIPNGAGHPVGSFAALGGSKIVGKNGKATVRMRADIGQESIRGFGDHLFGTAGNLQAPLAELSAALLARDQVRIEVAYHGQADDAADAAELAVWLSDFWTGDADVCGEIGDEAVTGQPFCPTFYGADTTAP